MLKNSFSIFPGIGPRTERRLWASGVLTWDDFLGSRAVHGLSAERKAMLDLHVASAKSAMDSGDTAHLARLLGPSGAWRLWSTLADDAVCLDIETDGRSASDGMVTVVGVYSHGEYRSYVQGRDLAVPSLKDELEGAKLLVTYFGGGFDLPYLKACYPGLKLDAPHFDLCPAGHKVGLKGGLKKVEKIVGITREAEVEGMSGYEAVLLWQAYLQGAKGALDTLISYNREDTVNLHTLAWIIYEKLREATGLPGILKAEAVPKERYPETWI